MIHRPPAQSSKLVRMIVLRQQPMSSGCFYHRQHRICSRRYSIFFQPKWFVVAHTVKLPYVILVTKTVEGHSGICVGNQNRLNNRRLWKLGCGRYRKLTMASGDRKENRNNQQISFNIKHNCKQVRDYISIQLFKTISISTCYHWCQSDLGLTNVRIWIRLLHYF